MAAIIVVLAVANEFLMGLIPQFMVDELEVDPKHAGFAFATLPLRCVFASPLVHRVSARLNCL